MMTALSTAATGMLAHESKTNVISNNLANASTVGYKRKMAQFEDLIYQNQTRVGSNDTGDNVVPSGVQIGLGTRLAAVQTVMTQGSLQQTERQLDIAINGKGLLRVEMANGDVAYTRSGSMNLNNEGQLVTNHGAVIMPGIVIPDDTVMDGIRITDDGRVQVQPQGSPVVWNEIGQLEMVLFNNESGLKSIGNNLFIETPSSGAPLVGEPKTAGRGEFIQGWLESSNVNAITEITDLITAQRGYELCSKVIQAGDEMMQAINRVK